ncbi:dihydrodipicolinate synthase family protein [Actinoalloteichus hymeniacidonis]|uniref:Dihydrodipicolinate synthase/N-acetylneuraminate lyase n=1 Tax=Actinoalloteichus hymeniacidonis TaxID=340345 RepID=A0AAC9HSM2_9PSEU|nr:dihydrodipicolinate synthase family protein [Actinoalloteichus hymeniacidonis]AOS64615.1 dihydrodipicolinate synthase/N-acetylneuraminate lyase [Actinoalloteichus hymeniacidonis]MBB5907312.1 4-hydroxy-tetrahydrodipicolinate synthase [Actinoalloteichus hymeniacidonis]
MYAGTIVPLITPLDEQGRVDAASVDRLIESLHSDVSGLMPTLSSGEGWQLDPGQWREMVTATVSHARGLPVFAGIQLPTTAQVVERARLAKELGVDAVVVTTPFGSEIGQAEIYQHYRTLRESVDIGLFVYNEAAVSGNSIELATLLRIFALPGVVGVKESSGSAELTRDIVAAPHSVPVFEGWENLLIDVAGEQGVAGFIGPLANLHPQLCNTMLREPTRAHQDEVDAACARYGIFDEQWYRTVKKELHARGVIGTDLAVADIRRPA